MGIISHYLFSFLGFALALLLTVRLMRERRPPGSTMAWLLAILLIPYVGVPLYLILGGRKIRRLAGEKFSLRAPETDRALSGPPKSNVEQVLEVCGLPPSVFGNQIEPLRNGEETYARVMQLIEEAKESIHITTFILGRDPVGRAIIDKLSEKARSGVKVRLLLDALGSLKTRGRFVDSLRAAGGQVGIFMPMLPFHRKWSANLRNHRKLLVVDHKFGILGGMNLGEEYLGPTPLATRWTDLAVQVRGPIVDHLENLFAQDWNFATNEALVLPGHQVEIQAQTNARLQIVPSGPDVETEAFYEALLTATAQARQRIWIVSPYFIPDEVLFQSLQLNGRLRRDVRIIVPQKSNHPLADIARGSYIRELAKAGVAFYGFTPGMIHAKILVVDDELAVVGSANMDSRSLHLNYEVSMFIHSKPEVDQMAQVVMGLLSQCERFQWERASGLRQSVWEWVEDASRIVAPLL